MTSKKRLAADKFKTERRKWAKAKARKPTRNPKYLAWLRLGRCIIGEFVTGSEACAGRIEAAHTGVRGLRQKGPDWEAVSLCSRHHRTGKDSYHVLGRNFWTHWKLDREVVIWHLQEMYLSSYIGREL
jgi:hypothetical protein